MLKQENAKSQKPNDLTDYRPDKATEVDACYDTIHALLQIRREVVAYHGMDVGYTTDQRCDGWQGKASSCKLRLVDSCEDVQRSRIRYDS